MKEPTDWARVGALVAIVGVAAALIPILVQSSQLRVVSCILLLIAICLIVAWPKFLHRPKQQSQHHLKYKASDNNGEQVKGGLMNGQDYRTNQNIPGKIPSVRGITSAPPGQGSGVGDSTYFGTNYLLVNEKLPKGEYLQSPDGLFVLIMQSDGNLVEYGPPGYHAIWATNTAGSGAEFAVLQPDGALVLRSSKHRKALWSNKKRGRANRLQLQPDGNLVAYNKTNSVLWANGKEATDHVPPTYRGSNTVYVGEQWLQNQYIRSTNCQYFVLFQADGYLVVYEPGYHIVCRYGRPSKNAGFVVIRENGELVAYKADGKIPIWGNGARTGGHYIIIQNDGNFVEYKEDKRSHVWHTYELMKS